MNQIDNKFFFLVDQIQNTTYEKLVFRIKKGFCFLPENIKANLENYFATYDFWGSLSEEKGDFDEIEKKAKVLKCHISDFVWLYRKLEDYSSKFLLFAILNNWLNYDFTSLKQSICQKESTTSIMTCLPIAKMKSSSMLVLTQETRFWIL